MKINTFRHCLIVVTYLLVLFYILNISGCGGQKKVTYVPSKNPIPLSSAIQSSESITAKLNGQYVKWRGTRYKSGGVTRNGLDCSAFVQITYQDLFNTKLPRTVKEQSFHGQEISRSKLMPGDLVFFKTGLVQRHVGIYVGNGSFMHVSASKGLMVSKLETDYWSGRYWKGQRLL